MFCRKCGCPLKEGELYCTNCGTIAVEPSEDNNNGIIRYKAGPVEWIIAIVFAVVVLLGLSISMIMTIMILLG